MLTTVHPEGQLEVPRVIVSLVPSAAGQVNVPDAATEEVQLVVALVGVNAENLTNSICNDVQPLNICL